MNPLLTRHLFESARRKRFFWLLSGYLLLISFLALSFTLLTSLSNIGPNNNTRLQMTALYSQGQGLYWASAVLLIATSILIAPISALGTFSGEREARTFDLLRTTTLRSRELVWGKLNACLLRAALYILAPLPLLMLGFWMGGITALELGLLILLLSVTTFYHVAWALFLSARIRKTLTAVLTYLGLQISLVPLIGLLITLLGILITIWENTVGPTPPPEWVGILAIYVLAFIVSLHPLSAGFASQLLWLSEDSWLSASLPLDSGTSITLVSPWIPYTLLALFGAFFLIHSTIQRLKRTER